MAGHQQQGRPDLPEGRRCPYQHLRLRIVRELCFLFFSINAIIKHVALVSWQLFRLFFKSLNPLRVVSFGAPAPNEYRLVVEGLVPISLQTAQVSQYNYNYDVS